MQIDRFDCSYYKHKYSVTAGLFFQFLIKITSYKPTNALLPRINDIALSWIKSILFKTAKITSYCISVLRITTILALYQRYWCNRNKIVGSLDYIIALRLHHSKSLIQSYLYDTSALAILLSQFQRDINNVWILKKRYIHMAIDALILF